MGAGVFVCLQAAELFSPQVARLNRHLALKSGNEPGPTLSTILTKSIKTSFIHIEKLGGQANCGLGFSNLAFELVRPPGGQRSVHTYRLVQFWLRIPTHESHPSR